MSKKKFFCLNDNGIFPINFFNVFFYILIFPINFFNVFFYVLQKNDLITKRIKSKFNSRILKINK